MLDEELIEEAKDGKYKISEKGKTTLGDIDSFHDVVRKQLDTIFRMGNIGKFVAMDILERMAILGNLLSSNAEKMTKTEAEKYKKFLEAEIKKLNEITKNKSKTA